MSLSCCAVALKHCTQKERYAVLVTRPMGPSPTPSSTGRGCSQLTRPHSSETTHPATLLALCAPVLNILPKDPNLPSMLAHLSRTLSIAVWSAKSPQPGDVTSPHDTTAPRHSLRRPLRQPTPVDTGHKRSARETWCWGAPARQVMHPTRSTETPEREPACPSTPHAPHAAAGRVALPVPAEGHSPTMPRPLLTRPI